MLAESLRHYLGDMTKEDVDVVVSIDGELHEVVDAEVDGGGRMVLRLGEKLPTVVTT